MASKKGKGFKISRDELNKKVEEYLAKGKTITKCEYVPPQAIGYSVKSTSKGPKTGEKLEFSSNLPKDLERILKKLRNTDK